MIKVSVIIPCLNMEKYIYSCLESIMSQTLTELEILVIDGGSTDGTLDIIDKLSKRDKRIRLIFSNQKSYGFQVNLGIAHAIGEYIAIVDADDRIVSDMYETLYKAAVQSGADYVKGSAGFFYTLSENMIYKYMVKQFLEEEYKDGKIYLVPMDRPDLLTKDNFLWYGIYRQEFIKGIRLHESPGAAFQDLGGLLQTQMKAQSAVYLKKTFYEYRQDNMEASGYNSKGFEFVWNEYIWAEQFIVNASDDWKAAFYRKFYLHTLDRYYAMSASGEFWKDAEIYINKIRKKIITAIKEKNVSIDYFFENEREDLKLFLEDGYSLYDKYSVLYRNKKEQISSILAAAKDREVVIFGYGQLGKFIHALLFKADTCDMVACCDNSEEVQNLQNIPVYKPVEVTRIYPEAYYIVANKYYSEDMRRQLLELGIAEKQICCYTADIDMRLLGERFI